MCICMCMCAYVVCACIRTCMCVHCECVDREVTDVAITNTYILLKSSGSCPFKDFKSFRLQLAKDLIGEYCSRRRRGRGGTVIHPLPFRHFPIRLDNDGPRRPRGNCALHRDVHHRRVSTTWFCREWGVAMPHRRCK